MSIDLTTYTGPRTKNVYGFEDYLCDIYGRIYNWERSPVTDIMYPLRPYGQWKTPMVKIHGHQYSVARIIADHFIPKPEGMDPSLLKVFHLDGMPHNNCIDNLVWATAHEIAAMRVVSYERRESFLMELRYEEFNKQDPNSPYDFEEFDPYGDEV